MQAIGAPSTCTEESGLRPYLRTTTGGLIALLPPLLYVGPAPLPAPFEAPFPGGARLPFASPSLCEARTANDLPGLTSSLILTLPEHPALDCPESALVTTRGRGGKGWFGRPHVSILLHSLPIVFRIHTDSNGTKWRPTVGPECHTPAQDT